MFRIICSLSLFFYSTVLLSQTNSILIHGHRGCRGLLPENTLIAMYKAIDLGVHALEIDLVVTADRQLLVSHDPYMLAELCSYPDGSAIRIEDQKQLNIYQMTLKEAQSYPCGVYTSDRFPEQHIYPSYKPSFVELVDSVLAYCNQKDISPPWFNIEIKSEAAWYGAYQPSPREYAKLFMETFSLLPIADRSYIQSFDPNILEELNKLNANLRLMLLQGGKEVDVAKNLSALTFTPYAYNPHYSLVNEEVVGYCQSHHIQLMVWTVNDESEFKRLQSMGVKHIITDYPNKANQLFNP